jgi:hypothetical protein
MAMEPDGGTRAALPVPEDKRVRQGRVRCLILDWAKLRDQARRIISRGLAAILSNGPQHP